MSVPPKYIKETLIGKTNIHCPKIGFGGAPIGNLFKKITNKKLLEFSVKGTLIFDLTNNLVGEDIINL